MSRPKLSSFISKQHRQREEHREIVAMEAFAEDCATGQLSDNVLAADAFVGAQSEQAAALVQDVHAARQLDSDASELREVEGHAFVARDAIDAINSQGGFDAQSFGFAKLAIEAIFQRTGLELATLVPSTEAFGDGKQTFSLESLDSMLSEVTAARGEVEQGSVDAILRVFKTLAETMPDVKARLTALQQVLPDAEYDETAEITIDDTVFQALAVNGAMPTSLKDYLIAYAVFASKILGSYAENAMDSAGKAADIVDELTASRSSSIIEALTEFLIKVGDPRKALSPDQLAFVLPGSGPLFGGKTEGDTAAEDAAAQEGPAGELLVRLKQFTDSNMALDPLAFGERPSLEAIEDEDDEDEDELKPFDPNAKDEDTEEAPAAAPVAPAAAEASDEAAPSIDAPADETAAPPAAGEEGTEAATPPAEPSALTPPPADGEDAPSDGTDPVVDETSAEPGAPPAADAETGTDPTLGDEPANPDAPAALADATAEIAGEAPMISTDTDQLPPSGDPAVDNAGAENPLGHPVDPVTGEADPTMLAGPVTPSLPTTRVLSKDTIASGLDELVKVYELVDINTFAEARQATWVSARSAYGKLTKSLMDLSPAQVAELRPLMPALGDYLDATFTLSAWPAIHLLTNVVFTANAFLLLAERSIAGKTEDVPADPEPMEGDAEATALPEVAPAGVTDESAEEVKADIEPATPAAE